MAARRRISTASRFHSSLWWTTQHRLERVDIQIYPSNFGVEFGRINLVWWTLTSRPTARHSWFCRSRCLRCGALIETPVSGLAVAVRRSYFDAILAVALPDDAAVSLSTAPRYYDSQILYTHKQGRHTFRSLTYGSSDRIVAVVSEAAANNPQARGNARLALEWVGTQAEWIYKPSDMLTHQLNVSYLVTSTEASSAPTSTWISVSPSSDSRITRLDGERSFQTACRY